MASLSVIIITLNEEAMIGRCLASVAWADEIIVIDSGSTDNTVAICQEYTDKVFVTDWPGYGQQKNRALAKATKDWVLSLDADEILTPELQEEIKQLLQQSKIPHLGYRIPLRNYVWQTPLRFGAWANDKPLRLFKRNAGCFTEVIVHESVVVKGKTPTLRHYAQHYGRHSIEDLLNDTLKYSKLGAEKRFHQGTQSSVLKATLRSIWVFIKGYFLKLGFLDGQAGFIVACANSQEIFWRYLRLYFLNQRRP